MTHIATWAEGHTPQFRNFAIKSLYWAAVGDTDEQLHVDPELWRGWAPVYCAHADHWDIADEYDVLVMQYADAGMNLYLGLATPNKPNDYDTAPVLFDFVPHDRESIPDSVLRYVTAWYEDYKTISPEIMDEDIDVYVPREERAS